MLWLVELLLSLLWLISVCAIGISNLKHMAALNSAGCIRWPTAWLGIASNHWEARETGLLTWKDSSTVFRSEILGLGVDDRDDDVES